MKKDINWLPSFSRCFVFIYLHKRASQTKHTSFSRCGFSSFGRARPCQGRGGGFEPRNPLQYGPVVQLVRTLACHARGRGFESLPDRQCFHRKHPEERKRSSLSGFCFTKRSPMFPSDTSRRILRILPCVSLRYDLIAQTFFLIEFTTRRYTHRSYNLICRQAEM